MKNNSPPEADNAEEKDQPVKSPRQTVKAPKESNPPKADNAEGKARPAKSPQQNGKSPLEKIIAVLDVLGSLGGALVLFVFLFRLGFTRVFAYPTTVEFASIGGKVALGMTEQIIFTGMSGQFAGPVEFVIEAPSGESLDDKRDLIEFFRNEGRERRERITYSVPDPPIYPESPKSKNTASITAEGGGISVALGELGELNVNYSLTIEYDLTAEHFAVITLSDFSADTAVRLDAYDTDDGYPLRVTFGGYVDMTQDKQNGSSFYVVGCTKIRMYLTDDEFRSLFSGRTPLAVEWLEVEDAESAICDVKGKFGLGQYRIEHGANDNFMLESEDTDKLHVQLGELLPGIQLELRVTEGKAKSIELNGLQYHVNLNYWSNNIF
jgi:hypothetical protein